MKICLTKLGITLAFIETSWVGIRNTVDCLIIIQYDVTFLHYISYCLYVMHTEVNPTFKLSKNSDHALGYYGLDNKTVKRTMNKILLEMK